MYVLGLFGRVCGTAAILGVVWCSRYNAVWSLRLMSVHVMLQLEHTMDKRFRVSQLLAHEMCMVLQYLYTSSCTADRPHH